jgi:hypothetical protein
VIQRQAGFLYHRKHGVRREGDRARKVHVRRGQAIHKWRCDNHASSFCLQQQLSALANIYALDRVGAEREMRYMLFDRARWQENNVCLGQSLLASSFIS